MQQPGGYPYQPPPNHPAPPAADPGTNGFAVASLVLGIIGGVVLSVVFGIVALVQIGKRGQKGRRLAIAGLSLSAVWVVLLGAFAIWAISTEADRGSDGRVVEGGSVATDSLEVGDCLNDIRESEAVASLPAVPCSQAHDAEVFAVFDLPNGAFPGQDGIDEGATSGCSQRVPDSLTDVDGELFYLYPSEQTWRAGDREIVCIALFPERTI